MKEERREKLIDELKNIHDEHKGNGGFLKKIVDYIVDLEFRVEVLESHIKPKSI